MSFKKEVIETVDGAGRRVRIVATTPIHHDRDMDGNVRERVGLATLRTESGELVNRISDTEFRTVHGGKTLKRV